ncbi:hypothetical protein [Streptomyces sp. NPDC086777]
MTTARACPRVYGGRPTSWPPGNPAEETPADDGTVLERQLFDPRLLRLD